MRRHVRSATLCVVALLVAGCAGSPPSNFYTLSPVATPPAMPAATAARAQPLSVVIGPVSIPAIVDLPQFVISTGPNQVAIDEYHRWASPLANNISRVVAENLVVLLGTPRVSLFQLSINDNAEYRVAIEVQSFESTPGQSAVLNAVWQVRRTKGDRTQLGRTSARETAAPGFDALAAAHSRALAKLSQDIADAIRALDRAAP